MADCRRRARRRGTWSGSLAIQFLVTRRWQMRRGSRRRPWVVGGAGARILLRAACSRGGVKDVGDSRFHTGQPIWVMGPAGPPRRVERMVSVVPRGARHVSDTRDGRGRRSRLRDRPRSV